MRQGVLDLRAFYATPLGRVTRQMISRKIVEAWSDGAGLDFLALGYSTPFLDAVRARAARVVAAMPASQGVEAWPAGQRNLACLVDEMALPMPNALFDRVLAVHALEETDSPLVLLREIRRVLAPSGRVILAVTARHGLWADAESSPFGHGRSYSRAQLERLLHEAELEPAGWTRALYAPPLPWAWRWAEGFEQVGARLWPPFAGVILMEAVKTSFAVRARPVRALAPARPAAQPVQARAALAFERVDSQPSRPSIGPTMEGSAPCE